jgi:hypothetical protein
VLPGEVRRRLLQTAMMLYKFGEKYLVTVEDV